MPGKLRLRAMMVLFQKKHFNNPSKNRKYVRGSFCGTPNEIKPKGRSSCLQYSLNCCSHRLGFQGDWPLSKCYRSKYWLLCIRSNHCFAFTSTDFFYFFKDCLSVKMYHLALENQSWRGDTIHEQSVVSTPVVCDACKAPAVMTKPLHVSTLELFFIVGLFPACPTFFFYRSLSYFDVTFPNLDAILKLIVWSITAVGNFRKKKVNNKLPVFFFVKYRNYFSSSYLISADPTEESLPTYMYFHLFNL